MSEQIIFTKPNLLRIVVFTERYITPTYIAWLNDQDVVRYSELRHSIHTLESCRVYFESYQNTPHFFWAIEVFDNGQWAHIGNINAYVNKKNNIADVGILIGEKSAWGKGYGATAWNAVCNYLLQNKKIRKVTGGAMSSNKAMLKIMQHSGMIEDGKRIKHYIHNNEMVDIVHYALFSEECTQ